MQRHDRATVRAQAARHKRRNRTMLARRMADNAITARLANSEHLPPWYREYDPECVSDTAACKDQRLRDRDAADAA